MRTLVLFLLGGCAWISDAAHQERLNEVCGDVESADCPPIEGGVACFLDEDGDGFGGGELLDIAGSECGEGFSTTDGDCDDTDEAVHPGTTEVATDGIDQDCDGMELCAADADGDGAASAVETVVGALGCAPVLAGEEDCDDADATRFPAAVEVVADGVDQDCDGTEACHADPDGDGFGSVDLAVVTSHDFTCTTQGLSAQAGDCEEGNPLAYPGADETCGDVVDLDCDGMVQGSVWYVDVDLDGFGDDATAFVDCDPGTAFPSVGGDCADDDHTINPAATEMPADGVDQDCDGSEDCFVDGDLDGFGDGVAPGSTHCDQTGEAVVDGDCDDGCADCFPGHAEICDGADNDCNLLVDDGATDTTPWYVDDDGDGYGNGTAVQACTAPVGHVDLSGDCADHDPDRNPGEFEVCNNGIDENCNTTDDHDGSLYFVDGDGDGQGAGTGEFTCTPTVHQVLAGGDCDDADPHVFLGNPAIVVADGTDQDCDGVDECYADVDNDGFGVAPAIPGTSLSCDAHLSGIAGDCDDAAPGVNPGMAEVGPDATDEDCDGLRLCATDEDGDGHGVPPLVSASLCEGVLTDRFGDCDDQDHTANPDATEILDNTTDEDCDGHFACYDDHDGDGFHAGDTIDQATPCAPLSPHDCADDDLEVYPGAPERCNGINDACGATVPANELDEDGDLFRLCDDDCDDHDPTVNPDGIETPTDEVDNDCSGLKNCYDDTGDGDGWGSSAQIQVHPSLLCSDASGSLQTGDCAPSDASVNPGVIELCDGIDTSCGFDTDAGKLTVNGENFESMEHAFDGASGFQNTAFVCGGGNPFPMAIDHDDTIDDIRGITIGSRPVLVNGSTTAPMIKIDSDIILSNLDIDGTFGPSSAPGCLENEAGYLGLFDVNISHCVGAITMGSGSILQIEGADISDNTGQTGVGVACQQCDLLSLTDVVFRDNLGSFFGAGVYAISTQPEFNNVVFEGNRAQIGSALYLTGSSISSSSSDVTVIGNTATSSSIAGAVYLSGGTHELVDWDFDNNVSTENFVSCEALAVRTGAFVTLTDTEIHGHRNASSVAAVSVSGTGSRLLNTSNGTRIFDNTVGAAVGSGGLLQNTSSGQWEGSPDNLTDVRPSSGADFNLAFNGQRFDCTSSGCFPF